MLKIALFYITLTSSVVSYLYFTTLKLAMFALGMH